LVDGGVHDNQGVAGLLDEGCTRILCSDASGQMADLKEPSDDPAGVVLRASTILQDRIREAEYQDLCARVRSRSLEGLFFIHTKKELDPPPLDWINCKDPAPFIGAPSNQTTYGIDRDLQAKIAGIRTDLDAFTDVEAYALMASGYLMTKRQFEVLQHEHVTQGKSGSWGEFDIAAACGDWTFRRLEKLLGMPGTGDVPKVRQDIDLQLKVASSTFFKAWHLVPALKRKAWLIGGGVLVALIALIAMFWDKTVFAISGSALVVAVLVIVASMFVPAIKWLFPQEQARNFLIKLAIALVGYTVAKVHLHFIDKLFLERGRLDRLLMDETSAR
jgi:hypothetical protein